MDSFRKDQGDNTRRSFGRARAARWAVSLILVAGAGLAASAQAASHAQGVAEMTDAVGCASNVRVDYDVQLDERIGAYAVAGVVVSDVPALCSGRSVRAVVTGADGEPLASERFELAEGAAVSFDGEPVDARDVTGLRVLPS